jgi:ubiquinone/menaquinone biosynthesis C-methylase UbiE
MKQNITELIRSQTGETLEYLNEGRNEFLQTQAGVNYQRMYDRFSAFYDIATQGYALLKSGNEKKRIMQYLSLLNIKHGDRVIEISIGTGRNIKHLNPKAEYYGVDISLGMLKRCQKKMKRLKREITLIQAEAESLPIKDESFDTVFSAGGFNFFNDPGRAVNEMLRVAKSGAKLLITDETEKFRLKHIKNDFYKGNEIKNPVGYLPESCRDIKFKEICDGDLYVLTFQK